MDKLTARVERGRGQRGERVGKRGRGRGRVDDGFNRIAVQENKGEGGVRLGVREIKLDKLESFQRTNYVTMRILLKHYMRIINCDK